MSGSLVSETRTEHIAILRLERPEALNAISGALADELTAACEKVAGDDDVWAVVLGAAGERAFCVGADLKERGHFTLEDFHANRAQIRGMFAALRALPQPTIAAIFGHALGGGFELALSCDIVVAAEGTQMGLPEVRVGLLPAGGGTQLLTRKLGEARAKDLIFRARRIDAAEAHTLGLVAEVCSFSELDERALAVARDVCRSSPVAVRASKWAVNAALGPLDVGIEAEHEAWATVIGSADRAEGIAAFNEKREPDWSNR